MNEEVKITLQLNLWFHIQVSEKSTVFWYELIYIILTEKLFVKNVVVNLVKCVNILLKPA